MKEYKLFIFDLDGTLIDSLEDLRHSINYAFSTMGIPPRNNQQVREAIGHGALRLIEDLLPETEVHRKEEAFKLFLPHYNKHCSENTTIYDGVIEYLNELQSKNIKMALLTNKPEEPTLILLERLKLGHFFDLVIGGDTLPTRKPDPAGIHHILATLNLKNSDSIMIGDSLPDISAAQNAGIDSVGISQGFGIGKIHPTYQINQFKDLRNLIF